MTDRPIRLPPQGAPPGWDRVTRELRGGRSRGEPLVILDRTDRGLLLLEAQRTSELDVRPAADTVYRLGDAELVVRGGSVVELRGESGLAGPIFASDAP